MSKILKGLNEVNPHNYDSDWDYEDAVARSGRSRSSYRSQEDDTSDADIAYSKKMYQLSQKQKRDADHDRLATGTNEEQLDELSNEKLGQYKTAAAADAGKADSEGDYKRADKRFSGIVKATKKQFSNDTKTVKEDINVVYSKAKSLLTQLDENTQQRVINALQKKVDDEQTPFKTGYPRVNNPQILGTQNRAKSAYYPPSKPNVKKLDKPLPENLGNELKSKSLEALQQVKQQLEQQRMADLEQWEKDFKQNTVSKFTAREPNLRQRATSTPMVAMPGEKHSELKTRLSQLNKAIEKQGILDNLVQKLDKKGLLTPNIEAGVDTSMLARDGARDNYVELNRKLDKALEYVKNRLLTNKAAYAKPKAIDEDDGAPTKMRMNDYYEQADAIQEKLKQAIQMGDKARMQELNKQRDELDAHVKKYGMMPEDIAEEQLDELSCWSGYHRVAGTKAGFPGSCKKNKTNEQELDEIDRRGFLKGMGAAAVVGAAGAGAYMNRNKSNFEGNDGVYVDQLLKLYYASKVFSSQDKYQFGAKPGDEPGPGITYEPKGNGPSSIQTFAQCKTLLNQYLQANPKMKPIVNQEYRLIVQTVDSATNPMDDLEKSYVNRVSILKNFQLFLKGQDPIFKQKDEFESVNQGVSEAQHSCPHCGGEMVSEELMNEKKDACYYKVKSRYKVWPSAYASGALVKCRKKGADSWGNGGKKNESSILEGLERADESLHDWFNKEKWVRMDTKGKIKGPCAREPGEGKPKCLPQSKAHSLGKKGRASAAQRKRREDPNPERSGKAINVNTKKSKG